MSKRSTSLIISAVAMAALMVALLVGCAASEPEPADSGYVATLPVQLPTAEPTPPPAAASGQPTAPPDTPTIAAATDTPVPPTYTPRPRPTYTPRPPPSAPSTGEREAATRFQAQALDGSTIDLTDTLGSPTLLAFWAPW